MITREEVIWRSRPILGREPENEKTIAAQGQNETLAVFAQLIEADMRLYRGALELLEQRLAARS